MEKSVLEVKDLTKRFKHVVAVDKISFSLREGEILGLLGPNGAGKTTTIQMLLGTLTPTSGSIRYFGKDFVKNRSKTLERVNYASAYSSLPGRLSIWENLDVYARIYGVKNRKERISEMLEIFDITSFKDKMFVHLSAGQRTRVILAKAFINFPSILLLDEPTASLDPDIADRVRSFLIREQKEYSVSMLFTSHNMAEIEEVCDRVLFIRKGKIIAEDTPEGLAGRITNTTIRLMIKDGIKRTLTYCKKNGLYAEEDSKYITIHLMEDQIPYFLSFLAERGIKYQEISIDRPTLEDFFLEMSKK